MDGLREHFLLYVVVALVLAAAAYAGASALHAVVTAVLRGLGS
jgi:hypothetical protein